MVKPHNLTKETLENNIALLAQAEELLVEVRATLNNHSSKCECCEKINYESWEEHINHDSIKGTLVKVRKHVGLFESWLKRDFT